MMNIEQIKKILPHRYPFLLIDRIVAVTEKQVIAIKNVTINEPYFVGHFPNYPIMPGVLIIEAMAQASGILIAKALGDNYDPTKLSLFLGIERARFKDMVRPADQLKIVCDLLHLRSKIARIGGNAYVDDKLVCSADLMIGFNNDYQ